MPRKPRTVEPGAVYHLISRFVDRDWYITRELEREMYLQLLGRALSESDWKCLAYAVMSNHKRAAEMLKDKKITPGEVEGARRAFNTRFAQQAAARQDRLKQITAAGMPENTAFPGAAKFLQPIGSAALGFLDAAGMGAGQMATGEEGKLFLEWRAARNPIAFNVGQFAGSVLGAPGKIGGALTAGLGASAAPALTRAAGSLATRIPAEVAVGAGVNALASGAITTAESVASGKDAVQVLRDVSTSMKFGAAFGAAGGSLAAGFRTRSVDKAGQQLLAEAKPGRLDRASGEG